MHRLSEEKTIAQCARSFCAEKGASAFDCILAHKLYSIRASHANPPTKEILSGDGLSLKRAGFETQVDEPRYREIHQMEG